MKKLGRTQGGPHAARAARRAGRTQGGPHAGRAACRAGRTQGGPHAGRAARRAMDLKPVTCTKGENEKVEK